MLLPLVSWSQLCWRFCSDWSEAPLVVTLAGDVPNYLLLMGTRKLRLNRMRIELHLRSRHHPGTETPYDSSQGFLRHQQRFRLLRGGSRLPWLLPLCRIVNVPRL